MMTRIGLIIIAVLVAVPASAQWRDTHPVLRLGIATGPNTALGRTRVEPFRLYLEDRLGVSVEILTAPDYGSLIGDQLTGRLHATFLSASAFAAASVACDGCVEPLVAPTNVEGDVGFQSILVVLDGSTIVDEEGLAGARLAVSAGDSLAGRLIPLALLVEQGLELGGVDLIASDSPAAAVALLLAGEADVAVAWTGLSGDPREGYRSGVLAQLLAAGRLTMEDISIIWTSPIIPHGPLAGLSSLPEDMKADLTEAMIGLADADREALGVVNGGHGGGFVAVEPELYRPLFLLADPSLGLPR